MHKEHTRTHAQGTDCESGFGSLRGALLDVSRCLGGGVDAATFSPSYAPGRRPPCSQALFTKTVFAETIQAYKDDIKQNTHSSWSNHYILSRNYARIHRHHALLCV